MGLFVASTNNECIITSNLCFLCLKEKHSQRTQNVRALVVCNLNVTNVNKNRLVVGTLPQCDAKTKVKTS